TAVAAVESEGPVNELVTGATVNPAVVNVPYGDVGNETVVTYLDGVDPTAIKICATDPSVAPDGQTVDFSWSYYDSNPGIEADIFRGNLPSLTITASDPDPCELFNGPPVIDPWGFPYILTLTETDITGAPSIGVTGISYQGNGSVVDNAPPAITITLGLGTPTR
ncbi:MAG: hypothetical protein ABSB52_09795, partial [Acidimicrobiales bacterium]